MTNPEDVLAYWLDELSPEDWYRGGEALDQQIRNKFESTCQDVKSGSLGLWLTFASGTLAYILVTDQFTRNIYRDQGQAFALDPMARAAAKAAISRGWDLRIDPPARQFFYLPLMHSENLCDQDRAVRLMLTRMSDSDGSNLLHAQAHREIIRQFGRFPFRNKALGRKSTPAEVTFLDQGGYRTVLRDLQAKEAA